jgi:RES domain-containing protein
MEDWKDGLNRDDLINALNDLFYHDLDSWFNVGTFYCESCVDGFIEKWPGIYNRDRTFQTNAIPLESFYEGGRINGLFTKEEFKDLCKDINCPNCGDCVSSFIWPYDINFEVPENFEDSLNEIARIAEQTPFLLLNHPFAQEVFKEIEVLSNIVATSKLSSPLFRARKFQAEKDYKEDDFLAANKKIIGEGRYNHAGRQVLYLAEDESTCFFEMRAPKDGIMLAKLEISKPLKILDLLDENLVENSIIQSIQLSSLLSSPEEGEGWYRPHYVFTRFVGDVAKSVGFDAIRYPSVRFDQGYNIVILNYDELKEKIKVKDFQFITSEKFKVKNVNR